MTKGGRHEGKTWREDSTSHADTLLKQGRRILSILDNILTILGAQIEVLRGLGHLQAPSAFWLQGAVWEAKISKLIGS